MAYARNRRFTPLKDAPARTWRIWAGGDAHLSPLITGGGELPDMSAGLRHRRDGGFRLPLAHAIANPVSETDAPIRRGDCRRVADRSGQSRRARGQA